MTTMAFIALLALVPLSGWNGTVERRLPTDFGVKAKQHIEALIKIGPLQAGTLNGGRAAGYIAEQFKAMGIPAIIEPFNFESFELARIDLRKGRTWEGLRCPRRILPPPALFGVLGTCYHPDWLTKSIDEAVKELDFQVQFTGIQGSDQLSFAQADIASSGVGALNGRGHTQDDMPETVNIEKVRQCAETAGRIIQKIWQVSERVPEKKSMPVDPMAWVRFLASDQLRGRKPGSPEKGIAARYIAERFRAAGAEALPGAPGYFQDVVRQRKDGSSGSPSGSAGVPIRARVSFANQGIPSLTVSPGFAEGDEGHNRKYVHTPADRVDADFDDAYLFTKPGRI